MPQAALAFSPVDRDTEVKSAQRRERRQRQKCDPKLLLPERGLL
jgi:hypothetical protein